MLSFAFTFGGELKSRCTLVAVCACVSQTHTAFVQPQPQASCYEEILAYTATKNFTYTDHKIIDLFYVMDCCGWCAF